MPCTEYNGKLFMKNPYLKNTRALFNSREEVEQLRTDLEESVRDSFKRIEREKRECIAHSKDKVFNYVLN